MRPCLNSDQQMFQDAVRSYLADHYGFEARQAITGSEPGYSAAVWRQFANGLGLTGLGFATGVGGIGGDALDLLAVIEPMGEAGVVEPFIETVVLAGRLLRASSGDRAAAVQRRIVAGDALIGCALGEADTRIDHGHPSTRLLASGGGYCLRGRKAVVAAAPFATDFLVTATDDAGDLQLLHLPADTAGIVLHSCRTIDGRRAADLVFADTPVAADAVLPLADARASVALAVDAATAAWCAEAMGVLGMILRDTLQHLRARKQFGQPLAQFQALQHRMADMKIALALATAATYAATIRLEAPAGARAAAVSAAKIAVADACREIGNGGIQLHGGIGMTAELPLGHRVQRATVLARLHGGAEDHILRLAGLADAAGLAGA